MGMSAEDILRDRLPETTPADTPVKPKPGEAAPTGETRVYAGKYKTPEDLEAAHSELQKKLGEQGDELGRMRALLVEPPAAPYTPARETRLPDAADPALGEFVTREEAQRLADTRFDERMRTRDEQTRQQQWYSTQQQRLREDFFARYPDLQKQQRLVKAIAEEFQGKYGHLDAPRFLALWPSIAKELADVAYADIAALKAEAKAEFERGAAERAGGQPVGTAGTTAPSPSTKPAPTLEELRLEAERELNQQYFRAKQPPSPPIK